MIKFNKKEKQIIIKSVGVLEDTCKKIKNKLMKDFYSEYENGDYCI